MTNNNFTCAGWTWAHTNRCNSTASWRAAGTCRASCFFAGNGYAGDNCCTSPPPPPLPPTAQPPPLLPGTYANTLYVDAEAGSDTNDGLTVSSAFASIRQAVSVAGSSTAIYVANGTYTNNNYGLGRLGNGAAVTISNVNNILLTNLPGHRPKVAFDGSGGIVADGVDTLEISGFEVEGPSRQITHEEAAADRLLHSARFSGRGIYLRRSTHVLVRNNEVHHTPNSGIRCNQGDYITVENNVVYNCTWWSSNAESAIVIAESQAADTLDVVKMRIRRNTVFGNVNRIPYYNSNYDDPAYLAAGQFSVAREFYGSINQTFIIDGSGVYVTRNSDSYLYGRFELSDNVCYGNGINGLVVHKTDRALVSGNVLFSNGQVSKEAPALRQAYAGLTLNQALEAAVYNNTVSANDDDSAYVID